jgi:hypothetical protein
MADEEDTGITLLTLAFLEQDRILPYIPEIQRIYRQWFVITENRSGKKEGWG